MELDITKLLGPAKWTYYYPCTIPDVFSRLAAGWMVAYCESSRRAERLIQETCRRQGIRPGQLTVQADRGSSMTSRSMALLLADLGATKTHSRPHVSNDNPVSEAQLKTLKYRPDFPDRLVASNTPRPIAATTSAGTTRSIITRGLDACGPAKCTGVWFPR